MRCVKVKLDSWYLLSLSRLFLLFESTRRICKRICCFSFQINLLILVCEILKIRHNPVKRKLEKRMKIKSSKDERPLNSIDYCILETKTIETKMKAAHKGV